MRVSVRKDDPGYRKDTYGTKVFVNEREVHYCYCFTADEETGEAFCHVTDNGRFVHENGKLKVIVFKGRVKIILPLEKEAIK